MIRVDGGYRAAMRVPRGHAGCIARRQTGRFRDRHGCIVRFVLLGAREERLASARLARILVAGREHGGGWASVSGGLAVHSLSFVCVAGRSRRLLLPSSLALVTSSSCLQHPALPATSRIQSQTRCREVRHSRPWRACLRPDRRAPFIQGRQKQKRLCVAGRVQEVLCCAVRGGSSNSRVCS